MKDIKINGGCFNEPTLFPNILEKPFNVVYGPNGSGKTTVARALALYGKDEEGQKYHASFEENTSYEVGKEIFVYNEDFIDQNVKFKDQLEPIVMIGEQVQLDSQLTQKENDLESVNKSIKSIQESESKKTRQLNEIINNIVKNLEFDYTNREKRIKGDEKKISIKLDDILRTGNNPPKGLKTIGEVTLDLQKRMDELDFTKEAQPIPIKLWFNNPKLELSLVNSLLTKAQKKPKLDENDTHLLDLAMKQTHYLHDAKQMVNEGAERCPLCQQLLTGNYKKKLLSRIELILNEEVKRYDLELQRMAKQMRIGASLSDSYNLALKFGEKWRILQDAVSDFGNELMTIADMLLEKRNCLYESFLPIDTSLIYRAYDKCKDANDELNKEIAKYNSLIQKRDSNIKTAHEMNLYLGYLENEKNLADLFNLENELKICKTDLKNLVPQKKELEKDIAHLKASLKQVDIAMDFINDCLNLVFFDHNRLSLESQGDNYILKANGVPVNPKAVSTGERNVIALSYFFASMFKGENNKKKYNSPKLVIIDDPISSFDQGNRMGVLALLKAQAKNILTGNQESKVTILSHDLLTIKDLESIQTDVLKSRSIAFNLNNIRIEATTYDLIQRQSLKNFNGSPYEIMLKQVAKFAWSKDLESDEFISIGNTMRRVLETYSTIMFKRDFVSVLNFDSYFNIPFKKDFPYDFDIRSKKTKDNLRNFLNRFVLNVESHSNARVDIESTNRQFETNELQRYSKMLLSFIFYTNYLHLKSYIPDYVKNINNWCKEEFGKIKVTPVEKKFAPISR